MLRRGFQAGGHVTWLDATYTNYIAVNNSNVAGDVSGNGLNNAPEWAARVWSSAAVTSARRDDYQSSLNDRDVTPANLNQRNLVVRDSPIVVR